MRDSDAVMGIARRSQRNEIVDIPLSHGRVYALRAATPSLFALTGSFRTAPAFDRGEALLQQLVATLTTCGSLQRDQFALADALESRGASLSVESEMQRVSFSAQACSVDLPIVMELLAECLRQPSFDAEAFATEQARLIAELHYYAAEPAAMTADALSRAMYPSAHPHYQAELAAQVDILQGFTLDDVRRYHREHFGANDLRVVVAGDIDPAIAAVEFDRRMSCWMPSSWLPSSSSPRSAQVSFDPSARVDAAQTVRIAAPGRDNFVVALGHGLGIRCDHPDYMAVWMANYVLGANFSSRLVATVREEKGLTYSIGSQLTKPFREFDGHWQIDLSLSPDKLDAGLAATRAEIARFVEVGVSAEELIAKKKQAIGAFQISLATLYGLSESILFGAERGWDARYIHEFADKIGCVTATQLNRTIGEHLRPAELAVAIAGPFGDL
jgi:zinc protease